MRIFDIENEMSINHQNNHFSFLLNKKLSKKNIVIKDYVF